MLWIEHLAQNPTACEDFRTYLASEIDVAARKMISSIRAADEAGARIAVGRIDVLEALKGVVEEEGHGAREVGRGPRAVRAV